MKNIDQNEQVTSTESDHDAAWRERIQRALRDLRSGSTIGAQANQSRTRAE